MADRGKIYFESDNFIELGDDLKLQNTADGTARADATVTAKLFDDDEVGGPTQLTPTITLDAVGGSDGLYRGTMNDDHSGITLGMNLRIEVTADRGSGQLLLKIQVFPVVNAE